MAERELFAAIILRAVQDLLTPTIPGEWDTRRHREDAFDFLTATEGPWARRREEFAVAAGLDPDYLRDKVLAIMDGRAPLDHVGNAAGLAAARQIVADRREAVERQARHREQMLAEKRRRQAKRRAEQARREARLRQLATDQRPSTRDEVVDILANYLG